MRTGDDGTLGVIYCAGYAAYTLELPWRENRRGVSCIPVGAYTLSPYSSPSFPNHYEIEGVTGRDSILIHSGNWAGDTSRGFKSDSNGCVLVGYGWLRGARQAQLTDSRRALDGLRDVLGKGTAQIVIEEVYEAAP